MTDPRELLLACIAKTGLSASQFSRQVVVRDPRTCWRWLNGNQKIPETVLRRLRELLEDTS